jgi:hypothetical protein
MEDIKKGTGKKSKRKDCWEREEIGKYSCTDHVIE